jgi:succinyl-diaminopimelate desuccinylase
VTRVPDPVLLAQALIRCPSVTPEDAGVLGTLEAALAPLGFRAERLTFSAEGTPDVENLYARWGKSGRNFCFAGHTDVVPVGDRKAWRHDPFGAEIEGGTLYGRGATDMKSAIAAMATAAGRFLEKRSPTFDGSISFLITNDEEGPSINGTVKVLDWLKAKAERLDACLVGEPTNEAALGDMMKIGRRGSVNFRVTVKGTQGHVAYPHLADNPAPKLVRMLARLNEKPLDAGTNWFQPSNLEITTIDIANAATNVIAAEARAGFNIRFNDRHSGASLERWVRGLFDAEKARYDLDVQVSGEAFVTEPGPFSDNVARAIEGVTGRRPTQSTTGGTSDARFIRAFCPVVEFGLVGKTMHKVDERAEVADIVALAEIYEAILDGYFAS